MYVDDNLFISCEEGPKDWDSFVFLRMICFSHIILKLHLDFLLVIKKYIFTLEYFENKEKQEKNQSYR